MDFTRLRDVPSWFFRALCYAAIGVVAVLILVQRAHAQPPSQVVDCKEIALTVGGIVDFRDTNADVELVVRMARQRFDTLPPAVLEREIRRMWREQLPSDVATHVLYRRCMRQLGDLGRDS